MTVTYNYSTMNSGKSISCLTTIHQYESYGYNVLCLIPENMVREKIDDDRAYIESRIGLKHEATIVKPLDSMYDFLQPSTDVIMIDEAQTLTEQQVRDLFMIAMSLDIPVFAFGLLTDFKLQFFDGSSAFVRYGAKLVKIHSIAEDGGVPVVNARFENGVLQTSGESIQVGRENVYKAMSLREYFSLLNKKELDNTL